AKPRRAIGLGVLSFTNISVAARAGGLGCTAGRPGTLWERYGRGSRGNEPIGTALGASGVVNSARPLTIRTGRGSALVLMENYDINRSGYHDTHDTMANIDLDYGAAFAAIVIEAVARAACDNGA